MSDKYINRELSWLEFNRRVLNEAQNTRLPLLDRLKFLAITASNLDEFFKVRVGGLKILDKVSPGKRDISGRTAIEQLEEIEARVRVFNGLQYQCLLDEIEIALQEHEIRRCSPDDLKSEHLEHLQLRFDEEFRAVMSPVMIDHAMEFPLFASAALCVCVRLADDGQHQLVDRDNESSASRYAVIPVPRNVDRIVSVPSPSGYHFLMIEDVLRQFVHEFFAGQKVVEVIPFRVTRNADMSIDEDGVADLLSGMTELLVDRKTSACVRLEIDSKASPETAQFLTEALGIQHTDVYACDGPIDLSKYMAIAMLNGFDHLRSTEWPPLQSPDFPPGCDLFEVVSSSDRILIHPYESYDPVVQLIQSAAADPNVIAIKQILYRTSEESAVVKALGDAAANGKAVTVIVELKARFDEERNIKWARHLEQQGVDVIYGVRGLKTHAKICVVVRREPQGIRRYLHFGTGNYNESTARLYGDISLLTVDEQLGDEAINIFNAVTGLSVPQSTSKLAFSPIDLRSRLEEMIQFEIANAREGRAASIRAKINSLSDKNIIDLLYEASQAGVSIELNVRGICCLRPGVPELSENIHVVSIVDRYLEHARIFHFHHNGDHRVFISSADWMSRNLDRRVELLIPVDEPDCCQRLIKMLDVYFQDNVKAQQLTPDGSYQAVSPGPELVRSQERLYEDCRDLHSAKRHHQSTLFEPHRSDDE